LRILCDRCKRRQHQDHSLEPLSVTAESECRRAPTTWPRFSRLRAVGDAGLGLATEFCVFNARNASIELDAGIAAEPFSPLRRKPKGAPCVCRGRPEQPVVEQMSENGIGHGSGEMRPAFRPIHAQAKTRFSR